MKNYVNEYEQSAKDFLNRANAKMKICRCGVVDHFPGDDTATGYRYKYNVRIDRNGKSYSFPFYDSVNNYRKNERPTAYDILACVEKYEIYGDIWDFASGYGYEIHDKKTYSKVNRIYNACKIQYNKLLRLFGAEFMEELQEIN